ncbi:MAG: DUF2279 domain-containing protein [Saprospiraceae bacterium]|nr:DUF2279 domain-containing protein [Saprospiraceae bacterium]
MILQQRFNKILLSLVVSFSLSATAYLQSKVQSFLTPADSFNSKRAWLAGSFGAATYTGFSFGLYNAWYKKSKLTTFHFFNDFGEWNHLDKVAHSYNSYIQASNSFDGARWCGYSEKNALVWAGTISFLFQSTLEFMDGLSPDYGFSWADMSFNLLGSGMFAGQQLLWHDQKLKLKISAFPKSYPTQQIIGDLGTQISIKDRVKDLYGENYFSQFLKDYNAQTFWLSFNPRLLYPKLTSKWPLFLNLAIGYGSDGLYGGFKNEWITNGERFQLHSISRVHQYYLSLDLDLKKIRTKYNWLNTALGILNIIKIPAPTIEFNSRGHIKGHWLFF